MKGANKVLTILLPLVLFFLPVSFAFSQTIPESVKLVLVTKGLTGPVGMAFPPDSTNRIFIIEQGGKIRILKNGRLLANPFLTISRLDRLNKSYSEKGLLGLAFHPEYKSNGKFYVYYSAPAEGQGVDHKSVLAEYKV